MSSTTESIWIDSNAALATLCQTLSTQTAIAIDTEFMRTSTFYPIAGLIQIGDGQSCYLIDPQAIDDFAPLAQLFANANVVKVLHACGEDLEVFDCLLGVLPEPLFDTQVAGAFTGLGFSLGYAGMIQALLNIEVPKGETRSDWLQRPLTQSQQDYAALDVAYLLTAYEKILSTLKACERIDWVESDCAQILTDYRKDKIATAFLRVKSAWKLNRRELAILQALSVWREQEARARDIPRNHLIKDNALWLLAKRKPEVANQLQNIEGLTPKMARQESAAILQVVDSALTLADNQLPERLPHPLPANQGDLTKALKTAARAVAEQLELPVEVLVRKKDFEAIVRSGMAKGNYQLPQTLKNWRQSVVGNSLIDLAKASYTG